MGLMSNLVCDGIIVRFLINGILFFIQMLENLYRKNIQKENLVITYLIKRKKNFRRIFFYTS